MWAILDGAKLASHGAQMMCVVAAVYAALIEVTSVIYVSGF